MFSVGDLIIYISENSYSKNFNKNATGSTHGILFEHTKELEEHHIKLKMELDSFMEDQALWEPFVNSVCQTL